MTGLEDALDTIADTTAQTAAQNQIYLNYENQIQYSCVPAARSWEHQSQIHQGEHSTQNQTPFVVWEN